MSTWLEHFAGRKLSSMTSDIVAWERASEKNNRVH